MVRRWLRDDKLFHQGLSTFFTASLQFGLFRPTKTLSV